MNNKFDIKITRTSVYLNEEPLKRRYTNSSRKIFLNKDYVVKVEWEEDRKGIWQCRKEKSLWDRLPMRHKKFFVPTLLFVHTKEYDYIVQPRVKIRFDKKISKREKAWDYIIGGLSEKYDLNDLYVDLAHNWGFCDGQPLIVDYGC
jgi:hypothetical protein